jgi:hypothetical protein
MFRAADPAYRLDGQVVGADVGAIRADRQGHVDPIVDDAPGAAGPAQLDDPAGELVPDEVRATLRADLHDRCAGRHGRAYHVERRGAACRVRDDMEPPERSAQC